MVKVNRKSNTWLIYSYSSHTICTKKKEKNKMFTCFSFFKMRILWKDTKEQYRNWIVFEVVAIKYTNSELIWKFCLRLMVMSLKRYMKTLPVIVMNHKLYNGADSHCFGIQLQQLLLLYRRKHDILMFKVVLILP